MSEKMKYIPHINSYEDIRNEMNNDLQYRLNSRKERTSLGVPLYYRINVQIITTQECPYSCPFCLERQNPMTGEKMWKEYCLSTNTDINTRHDMWKFCGGGELANQLANLVLAGTKTAAAKWLD